MFPALGRVVAAGPLQPRLDPIIQTSIAGVVGIAISVGIFALLVIVYRLMASAHNPVARQHWMALLGEHALVLVLLFGITTVTGILAAVYLHFHG